MKPADIVCTAVLPKDFDDGLNFVLQAFPATPAGEPVQSLLNRLHSLLAGKYAELAVERFLRSHGIAHQTFAAKIDANSSRFFFRVKNENVELKYIVLPNRRASAAKIIEAFALVPAEHWRQRARLARYIFTVYTGDLRLILKQNPSRYLTAQKIPRREDVELKGSSASVFLAAAPSRAECEQKFRHLPVRTPCLQYPEGLPEQCFGCRMAELTAFKTAIQWGGV